MTSIKSDSFFKNIVDGSNEALVFLCPNFEKSNDINEYVVVYANKKAESLFVNPQGIDYQDGYNRTIVKCYRGQGVLCRR